MIVLLTIAVRPIRRSIVGVARCVVFSCQDAWLASRRAEALLHEILTPVARSRLRDRGYLDVRSSFRPNRIYRVPGDGGIVLIRENGRLIGGLCVQSVTPIPAADSVARHKLMLESAEWEYLRQANHLSVGALSRYGPGILDER